MRMRLTCGLAALAVIHAAALTASAQNQFGNPGFEDPLLVTTDGPPFVGSWEAFNGGGAGSGYAATNPRNGTGHLNVNINNTPNSFAGAFQDVANLVAGQAVTFSGYHMSLTNPLGVATEFRIEWRNSGSNTEVGRTPNSTTGPGTTYSLFSLNATVPAGADTARAVYAIQTFGGEPNPGDNGVVFVDDMSFIIVPEPTSIAALGAASVLLRRRRR